MDCFESKLEQLTKREMFLEDLGKSLIKFQDANIPLWGRSILQQGGRSSNKRKINYKLQLPMNLQQLST